MNYKLRFLVTIASGILFLSGCDSAKETSTDGPQPPTAEKVAKELTANGNTRIDNYYWMKLTDEQKNAEVKDEQTQKVLNYLTAENEYLTAKLKHTEALQEKIYNEIIGRIKQTDESVPYKDNGYWYYTRYVEGQEYPIYCRKKGSLEAAEEIMLNVNEMAKGHDYFQVTGLDISEDNSILAYGVDTVSRRRYTIYFKDLKTGKEIGAVIPNTEGQVTWANDNKTIFYSKKDSLTLRSNTIHKHKLGTNPSNDPQIYEEKDDTFYTGIYKTKSDKFLIIWAGSTLTNHYQYLDANTPGRLRRRLSKIFQRESSESGLFCQPPAVGTHGNSHGRICQSPRVQR
jgi:oligopeptidase B